MAHRFTDGASRPGRTGRNVRGGTADGGREAGNPPPAVPAPAAGTRAPDALRRGVREAVTVLGTGFLRHPENGSLRERVRPRDLRTALLRLVCRLLFVFVAEDRDALLAPDADPSARERYERYFSSARLRAHARGRRGTAHGRRYAALRLVLTALGRERGRPELGLPGLGGLFTETAADAPLRGLQLSDEALLTAVRRLCQVRDGGSGPTRTVEHRRLSGGELGSVYASLLELEPRYSERRLRFELVESAGNLRKTSGSYYTPPALVDSLLESALDPVIRDAVRRGEEAAARAGESDPVRAVERELLSLKVCDPACGSGHFLVAAARRIAERLAAVRERTAEPAPAGVRRALHEVAARCVYGVDLDPTAVELAKVSLWLEAPAPGRPLGFLDARLKHGNGLFGATPGLLAAGVPTDAFKPVEGDDRKTAAELRKRNRAQRGDRAEPSRDTAPAAGAPAGARHREGHTTGTGHRREAHVTDAGHRREAHVTDAGHRREAHVTDAGHRREVHAADAWCAAFVWPKRPGAPEAPTDRVFRALRGRGPDAVPDATHAEIRRLREEYAFFHWHLEFPEVFAVPGSGPGARPDTGRAGGFDAVLGNPPWERVKLQEQEFFAERGPAIARARNAAARKRAIAELRRDAQARPLWEEFTAAKRRSEGESHFLRAGGRYPLTGRGDINTYAVFAEAGHALTGPGGRTGLIVPTGIATDATTRFFFEDLVTTGRLAALYDFENEERIFPGVHNQLRFCLLTLRGTGDPAEPAQLVFKVRRAAQIAGRRYRLTADDILRMNPNTGTCPVFGTRRDAEITLGIHRRVPVLVHEGRADGNPWGVSFLRMFDMANDSAVFRPDAQRGETFDDLLDEGWNLKGNILVRGDERLLPLYEAKMLHHYDHRFSTYEGATGNQLNKGTLPRLTAARHQDAAACPLPRYWVPEEDVPTGGRDRRGREVRAAGVRSRLAARGWRRDWVLGWRDTTNKNNERTMICSVAPAHGFGHKFMLALADGAALLAGVWSSFVLDYAARQSLGGTSLSYFVVRQLPVPAPRTLARHAGFIVPRLTELTYTSSDLSGFARELGDTGGPFHWDPERRAVLRAELDAFFFHLYGVSRDDTAYVLDTFNVTRANDVKEHGRYRTKELVLAEYDRMTAAGLTTGTPLVDGHTYTSTLTPPPGRGPRHPAP
ncbi:DNA methyltransferase [Streptomyces sp. NPDC013455]|uniref:Eco57I restriction-modification methylase domain-containing protein n=1 Tax=Streptomyces sp. NPDC013455 TaxID=3155605 RepID=UPI00340ED3A9